jgi:hypothetical protein
MRECDKDGRTRQTPNREDARAPKSREAPSYHLPS